MSRECELPDVCKRCGEEGHMVAKCTEALTLTITDEDGTVREIYVPKMATDELFQMSISAEDNFSNYDNIPVEVLGDNIPAPVQDFLCLRPLVLHNVGLHAVMTPIQMYCIPAIQAKRDVLALSGKTAAFPFLLVDLDEFLLNIYADSSTHSHGYRDKVLFLMNLAELKHCW